MIRIAALVVLVAACSDSEPYGDGDVLTLRDFFGEAHRRALRRADADPELRGLYADVKDAVVRVQVQYPAAEPGRTSTDSGCGVIVGDGRYVATAGHVVDVIATTERAATRVILTDGGIIPARVVAWKDELKDGARRDWALLELMEPPSDLLSLEFGEVMPGAKGILLGYPSRIGVDPEGTPRKDDIQSPRPLDPIACVVHVKQTVADNVLPVAGSTLSDGISGGPLVSADRTVVGIQHRITTHHEGEDTWITFEFDDARDLRVRLHAELNK